MTRSSQRSPNVPNPSMSRRTLLAGAAATGAVASVGLRPGTAAAQVALNMPGPADKSIVVIYLRGGVDGLSFLVPNQWDDYQTRRPNIAIENPLPLGGSGEGWALHPKFAGLKAEWDAGRVAFVHGAGLKNPSRSHFLSQDMTESGTNGLSDDPTGWIGRYLAALPTGPGTSRHRAFEVGDAPAKSLSGYPNALAITDLETAGLGGERFVLDDDQLDALEIVYGNQALYGDEGLVHTTMANAISLSREVQDLNLLRHRTNGTAFDEALSKVAALLGSSLQVQVVSTTLAARWDTHAAQGTETTGSLQRDFERLDEALSSFFAELDRLGIADRVTTVLMTEFGRRVSENGTKGTDHGKGGVMVVHGYDVIPQVRSVDVNGDQINDLTLPFVIDTAGTDDDAADEQDDAVAVTTDYRHVLSAVAQHALPGANLAELFPEGPGYSNSPNPVELFIE